MAPPSAVGAAALRRLLALARDLLQSPDVNSVLRIAGPVVQELMATDEALLLVRLGDDEHLSAFDRDGHSRPAREAGALCRHARRALADQTPVLLPDMAADAQARSGGRPDADATSLLALPFPPYRPVGVLAALWNRRGHPRLLANQVQTLRCIGDLVGAALGNVASRTALERQLLANSAEMREVTRQHEQEIAQSVLAQDALHRIAITDVMTGMLNRRGFFMQAEHALRVAHRQGKPSTLILVDIVGVKAVNDAHGHEAGDRLIRDCGRILLASFRDSDVVARMGGDEFAAFTFDSARPEAILARIYKNVDAWRERAGEPYPLMFSTGIARCDPFSGQMLSDYIALADKDMYLHKKARTR